MKQLSSDLTKIKASYDVVVVGSGYGGAIAASRMARANRSVCLLERGREIHPGEYPDSPADALRELQLDTPQGHSGSPTGLFDIRLNHDLNVVVGCGLGGTSLINANVSLEADPRIFEDPSWPRAVAVDEGGHLQTGYARARQMLQPQPYPSSAPVPAKLRALEQSARYLGAAAKFYRPLINVNFVAGRNPVGLEQPACNGCGDCVSGCNTGAKNTVLMNYLPDAAAHGAEIFTEVAVRHLERRGSRWLLYYEPLGVGRDRFGAAALFVEADVVLLGAGALGSTEILLRSAARGLPVSPALGHRFTGNGDVLGFGYNNDVAINGIGAGRRTVEPETAPGPCITGIIDLRTGVELQAGIIIEDGALPGVLAPLLPKALALAADLGGRDTDVGVGDLIAEKARELDSLVRGAYAGAVNHTQTYLVMSHDDGQGLLRLQDNRLRVHWPEVGRQTVFKRVDDQLLKATAATGGTYVTNPLWGKVFRQDLVTVHPLGGCPMADDAARGVVNDKGQVFSGPSGTAVHEGLYVCDGATIPRPLGVNPLLTISALAERCCALLAQDHDWQIDYSLTAATPGPVPAPAIGIRFTERMTGHLTVAGAESAAEFVLTISAANLEQLLADPAHAADLMGTVTVAGLSARPMLVSEGRFNLFEPAPEHPGQRRMRYQMKLTTEEGRSFWFDGEKRIHNAHGFDAWQDLTTLSAVVRDEQAGESEVAQGTLRIRLADLAQQLQTMQATNAPNLPARLRALARFGQFFAGAVFDTYGDIFARPTAFAPGLPRKQRPLRTEAPEIHSVRTEDGVELRLTRYRGGPKGPVLLTHGLGVSSRIFSLDTIDTNLLEYLYAYQYDVWLLDYRASISLPAATTTFTADEVAKQDYPAAVAKILQVTQAPDLQVVAHCFGATTFVMAMLTGLQGVRSAVCSQVAAHVAAPSAARLKAAFRVPSVLRELGLRTMTASVDPQAPWDDQLYDTLLALLPTEREEHCQSAVCHRVSFLYGLLYEHDQLNAATHATLHELFGVANLAALEHLARMVREEEVVSADGSERYFEHAQRLAIPITFIHGAENHCYLPRSTERTYEELRARNGRHLYRRHVIPNYGHIDCIFGQRAVQDVYPHILQHLDENAHSHHGPVVAAAANATTNVETLSWQLAASAGGVSLRVKGPAAGTPLVVFPGMEGSGESCLHLVEPVVQALGSQGRSYQIVLVDYSAEAHESLGALCHTAADLLAGFRPGQTSVFWAQSFGNLLAVQVAQDTRLHISRFVLGSPFTRLAPVRAHVGTWVSAVTPPMVYRGTIKPLGRYLFGPTGNKADHVFFEALYRADPDTVARRTGWLRGRDFATFFERLPAPAGVWLGQRDRLVERDRQIAFFCQLERQYPAKVQLHLVAEAGHVVLDSQVAGQVRDQVRAWLG